MLQNVAESKIIKKNFSQALTDSVTASVQIIETVWLFFCAQQRFCHSQRKANGFLLSFVVTLDPLLNGPLDLFTFDKCVPEPVPCS